MDDAIDGPEDEQLNRQNEVEILPDDNSIEGGEPEPTDFDEDDDGIDDDEVDEMVPLMMMLKLEDEADM